MLPAANKIHIFGAPTCNIIVVFYDHLMIVPKTPIREPLKKTYDMPDFDKTTAFISMIATLYNAAKIVITVFTLMA